MNDKCIYINKLLFKNQLQFIEGHNTACAFVSWCFAQALFQVCGWCTYMTVLVAVLVYLEQSLQVVCSSNGWVDADEDVSVVPF